MVHEWALAEAIVEYVKHKAKEDSKRHVRKLVVKLGVLQSIDKEILGFALNELFKDSGLVVDEVVFNEVPVILRCRRCGYEWRPSMNIDEAVKEAIHFVPEAVYSYFKCPHCGSRDFEIVQGRGVEIGEIIYGD